MLNGYFGNTGAGKTYGVVEYVVIPSLKEDRLVITNIPLEGALLTSIFGGEVRQLPPDWFEDPGFAESIPNGAVLILDEVWRKWPSGQNVKQVPVPEMALLKEHRHRVDAKGKAMRVVLVSQFPSDLASWVRKLIDTSFHMYKLSALGADRTFHVDVVKGCPTGDKIPKKLIIQTRKGTYKEEIYQFYRSATNSETGDVGDESVSDRRGLLWTSKLFWFCVVFGLCSVIGGPLYLFNVFFARYEQPAPKPDTAPISSPQLVNPMPASVALPAAAPVAEEPKVNPPPQEDRPPQEPGEPPLSKFWRVAGFIDRWRTEDAETTSTAVLLAGPGGERKILPLDRCKGQDSHLRQGRAVYVYCDIGGERISFWSGRVGVNGLMEGIKVGSPDTDASTERREVSASVPAKPSTVQPTGTTVTVVEDTSRMPRTLLGSNK